MSEKIAAKCCTCDFKITDDTVMEIHTCRLKENYYTEQEKDLRDVLTELILKHTENNKNNHKMRIREDLLYTQI